MVGVGGAFDFEVQVEDISKLPVTLKFAYQRPWETEPIKTLDITLNGANSPVVEDNVENLPVVNENTASDNINSILYLSEADQKQEIVNQYDNKLEQDEILTIRLDGNPTTGYSWILENANELDGVILLKNGEYKQTNAESGMVGVGGAFDFEVQVEDISKLPVTLNEADQKQEIVNQYDNKLEQDEILTIRLDGNPTTGYSWILENANELDGVILLKNGEYKQTNAESGMVGVGGAFDFEVQVEDISKLPVTLKFAYQRPWETEPIKTLDITLNGANSPVVENNVEYSLVPEDSNENVVYENLSSLLYLSEADQEQEKINQFNVGLGQDEYLTISFEGNPTTGYSWILENANELDGLKLLNNGEYKQDNNESGMDGVGGTFDFEVQVEDISKLPVTLKFAYMRPWETEPIKTLEIPLNSNSSLVVEDNIDSVIAVPQEGGNFDITVTHGEIFNVVLNGNPTTGYSWFLEDADFLKGVQLLKDGEYTQDEAEEGMVGVGGTYTFEFQVVDLVDLPTLKFVYRRPWETESISTAVVTVKSDSSAISAEDNAVSDSPRSVVYLTQEDCGNYNVEVQQNEIVVVSLEGNPTTGYSWTLANTDSLTGIKVLKYGDYEQKKGKEGMVGVGGIFNFEFQIQDTSALPTLKFVYKRPWETTDPVNTAEISFSTN
ncbi:hypothetical protein PIROE2DRAFT_64148 [Piromyces sp. E2]|nr:hypothetical protein PIROE2DRAFT_64148 [Piromyces sp. E2]|eukprot:OUM58842.1 hypothetical protein PIROE2DRAFT_64148 [Piromyces sp. E2]